MLGGHLLFPSCPPLPSLLFFHCTPHSKHSLTPHRARWAPGVDNHSGNLWELKNTHISNCALHTVRCKFAPPDPHQPSISAAHLDVFLRHLMVFPDHALVCIYLISCLLSFFICFLLFNPDFSKWKTRGREGTWSADELLIYCLLCWINVVVISLVIVCGAMKWHCVKQCCVLEQEPPTEQHTPTIMQMQWKCPLAWACINQSDSLLHEYVSVDATSSDWDRKLQ